MDRVGITDNGSDADRECEPESVQDVLDCIEDAPNGSKRASIADIVDHIGDGAFPPLMLVPALAIISPISAIFGVATVCGLLIATIAVQMVLGREKLWLPDFVLRINVSARNIDRVVGWFGKPAQIIDRLTGKRLAILVDPPLTRLWAALCLTLALVIPAFELVPMSATIIASAISLFTLAMLARDGLLAIVGLGVLGVAFWFLWSVAT